MEPIEVTLVVILLLIIVLGWIRLYLLPFRLAVARGHPQKRLLFYVNLLLGWTILGWLVVLVSALQYQAQEYAPLRKPQILRKSMPVSPKEVTNGRNKHSST